MKEVPRIGRMLDLAGLLIFLTGAGCYARAWFGFRSLPAYVPDPDGEPWASLEIADGFWRLQKIGVGLMVFGIAVFVIAWWIARRKQAAGGPAQGQDGH